VHTTRSATYRVDWAGDGFSSPVRRTKIWRVDFPVWIYCNPLKSHKAAKGIFGKTWHWTHRNLEMFALEPRKFGSRRNLEVLQAAGDRRLADRRAGSIDLGGRRGSKAAVRWRNCESRLSARCIPFLIFAWLFSKTTVGSRALLRKPGTKEVATCCVATRSHLHLGAMSADWRLGLRGGGPNNAGGKRVMRWVHRLAVSCCVHFRPQLWPLGACSP
jgi:hypothetical protein